MIHLREVFMVFVEHQKAYYTFPLSLLWEALLMAGRWLSNTTMLTCVRTLFVLYPNEKNSSKNVIMVILPNKFKVNNKWVVKTLQEAANLGNIGYHCLPPTRRLVPYQLALNYLGAIQKPFWAISKKNNWQFNRLASSDKILVWDLSH